MWALKVLNGPQAGQVYVLKPGRNRIGRSSSVDFQVNVAGISKEHLEFQVFPDKLIINDLKSSNGTFLNGVRVQSATVRLGDKLSLDKILFDVILAQGAPISPLLPAVPGGTSTHYPTALSTNAGYTSSKISTQTVGVTPPAPISA